MAKGKYIRTTERFPLKDVPRNKRPGYKENNRKCRIKRDFKIPAEEYDARKEAQGNLCAVCREPMDGEWNSGREPVLDHDHKDGQLREFIHATCNKGIGLLKDDPVKLRLAAEYLEKHNGKK